MVVPPGEIIVAFPGGCLRSLRLFMSSSNSMILKVSAVCPKTPISLRPPRSRSPLRRLIDLGGDSGSA